MNFEIIQEQDLEKIRELQPEGWGDIIQDFKFYIQSPVCYPIQTKINDKIVGVGTSISFVTTSWLAHIIVDNDFRNKGIGSHIVNELMEKLKKDSILSISLIATELGQPIYEKAGFRAVTDYTFLKREKVWEQNNNCNQIVLFQEKYSPMVYSLDKKISGEDRKILLQDYLFDSVLYIENNEVLGYYIPSLKEGLIFAETEVAGIELMKIKYSKIDKAVLPIDNEVGIEFLKQNGFVEINKKGTRMICGENINWSPKKIYSRIGGNFG